MTDIVEILSQRHQVYGPFLRQAQLACDLKGVMRAYIAWEDNLAPDQREALDMIQVKVARLLNGDPNYPDNWRDIEGYARLVADRLSNKD